MKIAIFALIISTLTACSIAPQKERTPASIDRKNGIRTAIRARMRDYEGCYDDALKRDKAASGKIVLRWTIADGGKVKDARVKEATLKDEKMGECLVAIINQTLFPEPPKTEVAEVIYPFVFATQAPQPKAN